MRETTTADQLVEVRLRYRPVGDVLTVCVQGQSSDVRRLQTEIDESTLLEWTRSDAGHDHLVALQLVDARARTGRCTATALGLLPDALRHAALDLLDPGRHHHDHPSSHRPSSPPASHEHIVRITSDLLRLSTRNSSEDR